VTDTAAQATKPVIILLQSMYGAPFHTKKVVDARL
jgi:hypothetical protein